MKKQLILATKNKHKIEELKSIMRDLNWELLTFEDIGDYEDIEETGETFHENALIKAKYIAEKTGKLTIADDSGLEIDFLGGQPGIMSARFGGEGATFEEKNNKVLKLMTGVSIEKRTARFVCIATLAWPDGKYKFFEGFCNGIIALSPSGKHGFGYDPIFYLPSFDKTMAELPANIKNTISHRAGAFQHLVIFLEKDF